MDFIADYDIGVNKPDIPQKIYDNWQDILDSLATIADVPSALVMRALPDKVEVASTSRTRPQDNPYEVAASRPLGSGIYCETVIKEKSELHVKNSLKDEDWKDNPNVAIDMISYYGQPLLWSDDTAFGTICILDKKDLVPSTSVKELLGLFRKAIENDLNILEISHVQKELLQNEIQKQTKQIKVQNTKLTDLNYKLEQRVKDEVEKSRKKDQQILQQSRLAQMGEMISMIAHQWRQPLGAIASTTVDLQMKLELDSFDFCTENGIKEAKEYFKQRLMNVEEYVQSLTTTIDDFRNFYKPNKESVVTTFEDVVNKALSIIKSSLRSQGVELVFDYQSKKELTLYENELMQVVLNILKNAQDNFIDKDIKNPKIKIIITDNAISICDNGGGIPEDIIGKIFDPYFSTKDEKNGTGLGLYMSKTIVKEHHNGKLSVTNQDDGVCFTIELYDRTNQNVLD